MTKQRWIEANDVLRGGTKASPEVEPSTERRTRSAADKLRILQEYAACSIGSPERGALLRREGIYTSQISKWRKLRDQGRLGSLAPQRRGPKAVAHAELVDEVTTLRKENARLQARLVRTEAIIDIQKKAHDRSGQHRHMKMPILKRGPWQQAEVEQLGAVSSQKS